jgi:hypothetical protein
MKPGQWSDEHEDGQDFEDPKVQEREDNDRYWEEHGNHGIECQTKEPKE